MNLAAIQAELAKDSYKDLSNSDAAELLNQATVTTPRLVSASVMLIWSAKFDITAKIQSVAGTADHPLQSAAQSLLLFFQGGLPGLDVNDPDVLAMLDGFVAAGKVSDAARAALIALGNPSVPFYETVLGRPFDYADVQRAREEQ